MSKIFLDGNEGELNIPVWVEVPFLRIASEIRQQSVPPDPDS
jgi:hypothetical protein